MNKYKSIKVKGKKQDYHRFLMEKKIGRKLDFNEVVHHKDGDKSNNDLENLEVIDRSSHSREHMKGNKISIATKLKLQLLSREKRPAAKLTIEQVLLIRAELSAGIKVSEIAKRFGVSRRSIYNIKNKEVYSWV